MIVPGLHGALNPDIRADMTLLEIPESGGAVFSVGSICWIGSLPHNDYDNNVSRITWNVLAAFSQQSVPYTSDQTPSRASWMGLR
jgi:N,N-dimethylformamidase